MKNLIKELGKLFLHFAAGFTITMLIIQICVYFNIGEFMTGYFACMGYFACKEFYEDFIKNKEENKK